ncbi:hypothetical protein ACOMHN_019722 [Nucella lapillus]
MGKRYHNFRNHSHSQTKRKRLRETDEITAAEFGDNARKYAKVEEDKKKVIESSSSSEESEEESVVKQICKNLGTTLKSGEEENDDEEETSDEEEEEDDEEESDSEDGEESKEEKEDKEGEDIEKQVEGWEEDDDDEDDVSGSEDSDENNTEGGYIEKEDDDNGDVNNGETEDGEKEEEEIFDNEEEQEEVEHHLKEDDPFSIHFDRVLTDQEMSSICDAKWKGEELKIKGLGTGRLVWKDSKFVSKGTTVQKDLKKLGVKHKLADQVAVTNVKVCGTKLKKPEDVLTSFQHGLFSVINKYQDLLYSKQTYENSEQIRLTYCLHAVNHVLKTRSRVVAHNTKLKSRAESGDSSEVEYRDQGLTRPKVLIVVPTRHVAYRVISIIISLLSALDQEMVSKRKRFNAEFGPEGHDDDQKGLKPEDYNATFSGNTDEHFRIGVSVSKKSLRLYSPFYMADIILASPLGLRTIIGAPGDRDRDFDFLSSIEVMILDHSDFFQMQNWDHLLQILDHMHKPLQQVHNMDFTRSRLWSLNGWSKHYRQTLIFSLLLTPEIYSVFKLHCHNYSGKMEVLYKPAAGSVCQVFVQLPQMFHRIDSGNPADIAEARFQFFLNEVLPQHKEKDMKRTLIFIPDYFDFVRIRNYFKKEAISFAHINEYATSKGIRRGRIEFKRGRSHFMLYTERVHFYRRFKLRGIRNIIFYELPQYPHFYSEMCNLLSEPGRTSVDMLTCTVLYSPFDIMRLTGVVGAHRAQQMVVSDKKIHMLVSGDAS